MTNREFLSPGDDKMNNLEPSRCALFIDFDNMYLGLLNDSKDAAERFATNPALWLNWLEKSMPGFDEDPGGERRRRLLIRKCYLNPGLFGKYRTFFARHGFTVVDCPALTMQGKNSADIVMVMDIIDSMNNGHHIEEFILMSADADFTPLFIRLRASDRRTTAIISTPVAAAYRGACDLVVEEHLFVSGGLKITGWKEAGRNVSGKISATKIDQKESIEIKDNLHQVTPALAEFIRRMHDLTEAPMLAPQQYTAIFRELAGVLNNPESQRDNPYKIAQTVRDRCKQAANPVGVNPISLVLRFLLSNHRQKMLDPTIHLDAITHARNFYGIVTQLLANARAELDDNETSMLEEWLLGRA